MNKCGSLAVIEASKGETMKIRFTSNCEYLIQKKELYGGAETTSFDAGEEYEVETMEKSDVAAGASDIFFKNGWVGYCLEEEDFEVV